jgi:hypothetical protein
MATSMGCYDKQSRRALSYDMLWSGQLEGARLNTVGLTRVVIALARVTVSSSHALRLVEPSA